MKQEHKDFLEANIGNYHTIQNGYVRNLDIHILNMYEHIYKEYLDKHFVLTKWCSDCVFSTLKRLYDYYLSLPQQVVQSIEVFPDDLDKIVPDETIEQPVIKKRGRRKQSN